MNVFMQLAPADSSSSGLTISTLVLAIILLKLLYVGWSRRGYYFNFPCDFLFISNWLIQINPIIADPLSDLSKK